MNWLKSIMYRAQDIHGRRVDMSLVSGVVGGVMGRNASKEASEKAENIQRESTEKGLQAQREALDYQKELYGNTRKDFSPYTAIGEQGAKDYTRLMSGGYDMKESPAAQYQLTKGSQALGRALAARGLSGSGNAAQRFADLNSSIAASDWNNQYTRILDALKLGTGASSVVAGAGNALGGQVGANASNTSSIYGNQGNNMANIYQNEGANEAKFWSGMGGLTSRAAATGISAYAGGMFGGGSGMGGGGSAMSGGGSPGYSWGKMPEFTVNESLRM